MATLKYSRQRESIKEFLRTRTDHPTADVVYENMKLIYPNISLGTVYRNRHQIPEETLLHRRQITCQTHTHIHTSKEKRRQDDHYHTLYVIFLFHQI